MGTGSFSIPFPVTKARDNEPSLSINYNSGSGNGSFGLGFSLSIPKISLKTSLGIPKYKDKDTYLLNGEELVKNTSVHPKHEGNYVVTEYLQRVEGTYSLIKHCIASDKSSSYWEVTTTKNHTSIFGKTQASQIFNPKKPQQIFEWLLSESHDAHGNHSQYVYKAENRENVTDTIETQGRSFNNKYLERIKYGNYPKSLGDKYAFEVIFDYGEYNLENLEKGGKNPYRPANKWKYRPDAFSSFLSGFEIRTCRLCENILLFHHFEEELGDPCLVKRLSFGIHFKV